MMMTLGIDASRANAEQKTGVGWYAYELIEALKKVIPADNCRVVLYTDMSLRGEFAKLPSHWRAKELWWPTRFFWAEGRLSFEMLAHAPDVLFMPASPLPIICPKRTVNTIHDIGFARRSEYYPPFKRLYLDWSTRRALARATAILAPSEFTKKELSECYPEGRREGITVTPIALTRANVASPDKDFAIPEGRYFIFIGRLIQKKNITRLIEAFRMVRGRPGFEDVKLALVGPVEDIPPRAYFESLPERGTSILQYSWLAPEKVSALLHGAAGMVLPSLYEGFGMPILEGFAAGVPVITSKEGATEEVAGGAALLVDPHNTADIADALEWILQDTIFRENLVVLGRERLKEFSWEKCARLTWEAIKGPLGSSAPPKA
ncbi:MAG: glycosyltransferase family 1 protein [Patescibacteria group bacterium]